MPFRISFTFSRNAGIERRRKKGSLKEKLSTNGRIKMRFTTKKRKRLMRPKSNITIFHFGKESEYLNAPNR